MRRDMLMIDGLQYVNWNRELFDKLNVWRMASMSQLPIGKISVRHWKNRDLE